MGRADDPDLRLLGRVVEIRHRVVAQKRGRSLVSRSPCHRRGSCRRRRGPVRARGQRGSDAERCECSPYRSEEVSVAPPEKFEGEGGGKRGRLYTPGEERKATLRLFCILNICLQMSAIYVLPANNQFQEGCRNTHYLTLPPNVSYSVLCTIVFHS